MKTKTERWLARTGAAVSIVGWMCVEWHFTWLTTIGAFLAALGLLLWTEFDRR